MQEIKISKSDFNKTNKIENSTKFYQRLNEEFGDIIILRNSRTN